MVDYWYPFAGHPDGESEAPWFRVLDGRGYRTEKNPAGASVTPAFSVIDGWAYPIISMPHTEPTFQIVGSFVYAPEGPAWFRIQSKGR
jgi:hypothetical protein